jgi:HipA-like protein
MISTFFNKIQTFFKSEDQEDELVTLTEDVAEFELIYQKTLIGNLTLKNGVWTFAYSSAFKEQNQISNIVDFPNKEKIYQSPVLFPFFSSRIPSLQRLKLQKIIAENTINDEVLLLKKFGKQSIANPYQLIAF